MMPVVTPDGTYSHEEYHRLNELFSSVPYKETCALIKYWSEKLAQNPSHNEIVSIIKRLDELRDQLEKLARG